MLESVVLRNRQSFRAKWEEIPNNGAILFMPLSNRLANLRGDDGKELSPERKSRHSGDVAQRRKVEWIDIA